MGVKLVATLSVEFEMEDGQPSDLAGTRLRTSMGHFQRYIEVGEPGVGGFGKTGVKHHTARVEIIGVPHLETV